MTSATATPDISVIATPFMPGVSVNCYLAKAGDGFALIDTGMPLHRSAIEKQLESLGCKPGNLKLIVLTHGDLDHHGNAAYFRQKFGARVAMHNDDSGMVARGDMFWNRKKPNAVVKAVFGLFYGLFKSARFEPDFYVDEGYDFSAHGFDGTVVHLPGHSKGSIGIVTAGGDLFCGDLFGNLGKPELWSLIDDAAAAQASVARLKSLQIATVYPGHGKPFSMAQLAGA